MSRPLIMEFSHGGLSCFLMAQHLGQRQEWMHTELGSEILLCVRWQQPYMLKFCVIITSVTTPFSLERCSPLRASEHPSLQG